MTALEGERREARKLLLHVDGHKTVGHRVVFHHFIQREREKVGRAGRRGQGEVQVVVGSRVKTKVN